MGRAVLVIGGGVAGLAAAWRIARDGGDPLVLEAGDRPGGYVHTVDEGGARVELGPQGFLQERPGVLDVVDELGLADQLLPAAAESKTRYLLHDGALVALPASPPALLSSPLLSFRGKARLLMEPWARPAGDAPETVHGFASRRIGREAADVLVDAAVTGIFAGDPKQLSVDACFPKMPAMEREHGGLFRAMRARKKQGGSPFGARLASFRAGMQALTDAYVRSLGDRVVRETPVTEVARDGSGWRVVAGGRRHTAEAIVVATPARVTARLLADAAPEIAAAASEIPAAPVAVCALVYARRAVTHPLDGYGFLVPGGRYPVLGCLFESTVFPPRVPADRVLLRALLGGARNPAAVRASDAEIVARTVDALRTPLGLQGDPDASVVAVHEDAIPQYDTSHPARLKRVEQALTKHRGLVLAGSSWYGVAVNRLVADAERVAEEALASSPR